MVEEKSSWTPSYSVTHLPGASPKGKTKEELPTSRDTPAVDGPVVMETESPVTDGAKTEPTKGDEPHCFPQVPESLDEAPER